jgi:hypothetical protein
MKLWIQCSVLLLLILLYISHRQKWTIRSIMRSSQDVTECRSGDLLYFLEYGSIFPFPGHLAICVKLPQYGQIMVYEMINMLYHAPDLLKPLQSYIKNCKKRRCAKVFIQRLTGPDIDLLPSIKYFASSSHFDLNSGIIHANLALRETLLLPSLPMFLPPMEKKELYYCTNTVLTLLNKVGVINKFWSDEEALCPMTLLDQKFNLNAHTNTPWKFLDPQEL